MIQQLWIKEIKISNIQIDSPKIIAQEFEKLKEIDQETFWILGLDSNNNILLNECLFKGGLDYASIDFRLIFKRLITVGASSLVVIHNHPSGNQLPSHDDDLITTKIITIGVFLNIDMLDHIIIGEEFFSYNSSRKNIIVDGKEKGICLLEYINLMNI